MIEVSYKHCLIADNRRIPDKISRSKNLILKPASRWVKKINSLMHESYSSRLRSD